MNDKNNELDLKQEDQEKIDNANLEDESVKMHKDKKINPKKTILIGGCVLAVGLGYIMLENKSNTQNNTEGEFEDFYVKEMNPVELDFNNKTAQEMREYYTLEGEEYIKKIYPNSEDSDLALLTIGKSTEKEFSNIKFTTTSNKEISLKELKGKRIILDFALSSCPSCREEFELFSKNNAEDDIVLHIFPNDTTEEIKSVFKEENVQFNEEHTVSLTGMNNLSFDDFNITHVPTKIYINEEGIVTYVTTNTISDEELYKLHYDRAFGDGEKMLDFLKNN